MVLANARDGSTVSFDLAAATDRARLADLIRRDLVTGLSLHFDGVVASLPAPRKFASAAFGFDFVPQKAEVIHCQAEGVRVTLTRTFSSKHVRCDLVRTGRRRYNPAA